MTWKATLATHTPTWAALEEYAEERIHELTSICISTESSDQQIRSAQAGIMELQRLVSMPKIIATEAQMRAQMSSRKEY